MNKIKFEPSSVNLGDPLPLPYKIITNPKLNKNQNDNINNDITKIESDNEKIRRIYSAHKRNEFNIPELEVEPPSQSQPKINSQPSSSSNIEGLDDEDDTTAVENKRINTHILKTRNFKSYPANDKILNFGNNRNIFQQQQQPIQRVNTLIHQLNELIKYSNDKHHLNNIKLEINKLIKLIDEQEQISEDQLILEQERMIDEQETNIFEELDKLQQQQQQQQLQQTSRTVKTPQTQSTVIIILSVLVLILVFLLGSYLLADLNPEYCYLFC
ncbi:hypothetical protein DFJ63DRAFT_314934 [Scheffersomyces coipomensis]|uniref:uncharacterized protein n=1 Tax=Scheffersomyces coipomensis TaxID=1788519 RepID=UPI00315C9070